MYCGITDSITTIKCMKRETQNMPLYKIKGTYISVKQSKNRNYYMPSFHRNLGSELFF